MPDRDGLIDALEILVETQQQLVRVQRLRIDRLERLVDSIALRLGLDWPPLAREERT